MSVDEFKGIFWWEYFHRLLGRLIGVAFLVPYLWFLVRRRIPPGYAVRLAGIFVLGGLQGALGWYMVKSGLVDDPRVSQFRLTAHLGLAFVIFAAMFWTALSLLRPPVADASPAMRALGQAGPVAGAAGVRDGADRGFVVGIGAGFAYNTWPLMNGTLVPPELFMLEPWWSNFFWNMATVQFQHRLVAYALAVAIPLLWWRVVAAPGVPAVARAGAHLLLAAIVGQIALGIATLLLACRCRWPRRTRPARSSCWRRR